MNQYGATVAWHLAPDATFDYEHFNRNHEWTFAGGEVIQASASPDYFGSNNRVNPDEAVVAATSSCHMLTFLSIAAKKQLKVLSYIDQPQGTVDKNENGAMAMTKIVLRPRVVFEADVSAEEVQAIHDSTLGHCFVANSLKSEIVIEPVIV